MWEWRGINLELWIGIGLLIVLVGGVGVVVFFYGGLTGIDGIDIGNRLVGPGLKYWLGTDVLGRDLLVCMVKGVGLSVFIGIVSVFLSASIGGLVGMVAGFLGRGVDKVIMRVVDVLLAFPGILLAICLVLLLSRDMVSLILIMVILGWASYVRVSRAQVIQYRAMGFVVAASGYNASFSRIIFHYLMPQVLPLLVIQASLNIAGVILVESSLNFLGLGLDPMEPTLGQLIDVGREHMYDRPMLMVGPGLVLFWVISMFHFIGEGLRKTFSLKNS